MNTNTKYSFDEQQVRTRFLEQMRTGIDGAWEKFESYMNLQQSRSTKVRKNKLQIAIPPVYIIKALIAALILLISFLLFKHLDSKLPPSLSQQNAFGQDSRVKSEQVKPE